AEVAASTLGAHGVPARAARVLEQRRGARDQVGLGARARGRNLSGRVVVRRGERVRGSVVVVVDDVLTTGATLAGTVDALETAGARVLAGLVLAATPSPARRSPDIPAATRD
ncbi:MAG: ComF family protein, partial [Actinomycetota bacterium]|nr:ComF family protein [Actinomycetota bacterium]